MTIKTTQIAPSAQSCTGKSLLLLACLFLSIPQVGQAGELFAYIDPFTGSLLLQVLVGGFMGIMIFFKKIKAFAFGFFGNKKNVESIEDTDDPTIQLDDVPTIRLNASRTDDHGQQTKAA